MLGFLALTQSTRSGDRTTRLGDVYDGLRLRTPFNTVSTRSGDRTFENRHRTLINLHTWAIACSWVGIYQNIFTMP